MNLQELKAAGHALALRLQGDDQAASKQLADTLRSLAGDERFAAVLALIEWQKADYISWVGQQKMAEHHGSLAHCAGSIRALDRLQQSLDGWLLAKRPQAKRPEPDEG